MAGLLFLSSAAWGKSEYRTLYKFTGGQDGGQPFAGVIFDQSGSLYGTTASGGFYDNGTVFQLTQNADGTWAEHVLYRFCSRSSCSDGTQPWGGLTLDAQGNLYGTTFQGGTYGTGEVFKLTPNSNGTWSEKVLYGFSGADGSYPEAGVIIDANGNLYGTTYQGGAYGAGVVFKLTHTIDDWAESVLYSLCSVSNCRDGAFPSASLILDKAGRLYGTATTGGDPNCSNNGCGVVFRLAPHENGSWKEDVLYTFTGDPDGAYPANSLTLGKHDTIYGATAGGGTGSGTVFKLMKDRKGRWQEMVILTFNEVNGGFPGTGPIESASGTLYGATGGGGDLNCHYNGCGVVFKLARNRKSKWNEGLLHVFVDSPGIFPSGSLIFDGARNLYGTTAGDNVKSHGSVYRLKP